MHLHKCNLKIEVFFVTVTFFGNRDASADIKPKLRETIIQLITKHKANNFYVGNNGNFDLMVAYILKELKKNYDIKYTVVLAYLPTAENNEDYENTIYPEGIEKASLRFAICRRNDWMLEQSDLVITYVRFGFGGAAKYKEAAKRKGMPIIELYQI